MAEDSGLWLYAAAAGPIGPGTLDELTGVGGQPVRAVEAAGLTAAVTPVNLDEFGEEPLRRNLEDLPWLEAVARAHHHVIAVLSRRTPVIPVRLATVYRDEAGITELLVSRRAHFTGALERVSAKTEWGVKVYLAPLPSEAPEPVAGGTLAAGSGTAYLLRRRRRLSAAENARRAAAASAEDIHATLAGLASAAQLRPPHGAQLSGRSIPMILNAAYLVPDDRAGDFGTAAGHLAARHPAVTIERTGPWPPYTFTAVDDG